MQQGVVGTVEICERETGTQGIDESPLRVSGRGMYKNVVACVAD